MDFLEWVKNYGVGNATLDSYHHIFHEAVTQMDEMAAGNREGSALERMHFLLSYCAMHFEEEESLLQQAGYPELERHRGIHARFHRRMQVLYGELEKDPSPRMAALAAEEARLWWLNHIQGEDRKFAPFLVSQES